MWGHPGFKLFKNQEVGKLVDKSDEKGIPVEIVVDGDAMIGMSDRRAVIAKFGLPVFCDGKMDFFGNDPIIHFIH